MTSNNDSRRKWPIVDENGDFIWRFQLEPDRHTPLISDEAFAELFRSQLDEMLKLIVLTWRDKRVRIDGFRFINRPDHTYAIWAKPADRSSDQQS
jgi:hypothetical protein